MAILLVWAALSLRSAIAARGGEQPTIVLVADRADATIIATLRAELTALGLRALVVPRGESDMGANALTAIARQRRAIAAFRVLVEERRVEVWLADRVTGKVLLREVLMTRDAGQSQTDESMVVARAVELLRASLLELDLDDRPPGDVGVPAALPIQLHPSSSSGEPASSIWMPRFGLTMATGLLAATPNAPMSVGLDLALRWHVSTRIAAVVRTTAPFSRVTYSAVQGRGEITPRWASAGFRYWFVSWAEQWRASLETGVGLLMVDAVGVGQPDYRARSTFELDPVVYGGAEVRWSLSRPVAVSVGVLGGPGLRPTKFLFDEQVIDHYGRWVLISQFGLDLTWR